MPRTFCETLGQGSEAFGVVELSDHDVELEAPLRIQQPEIRCYQAILELATPRAHKYFLKLPPTTLTTSPNPTVPGSRIHNGCSDTGNAR